MRTELTVPGAAFSGAAVRRLLPAFPCIGEPALLLAVERAGSHVVLTYALRGAITSLRVTWQLVHSELANVKQPPQVHRPAKQAAVCAST